MYAFFETFPFSVTVVAMNFVVTLNSSMKNLIRHSCNVHFTVDLTDRNK